MKKRTNEYLLNDLKKQNKSVSIGMGVPKDVRKVCETSESSIILNLTVFYGNEYVTRLAVRGRHFIPSGGGWRIAVVESLEEALAEVGFLNILMSLKLGVGDEPFGGAKAVLVADPKNTPQDLLDLLSEEFGRQMAPYMIGPDGRCVDRIAPDMNTNHKNMEFFLRGVRSVLGGKIPDGHIRAFATGKEPDGTSMGGLLCRPESTGYEVAYAAKLAADMISLPLKGARVVIQGWGKVGIPAAERVVNEYGAIVVAVSDSSGGVVNYSGLDIEALKEHKKKTGTVVGLPGTTFITNENLLELECDILMPCAKEGQITSDNAERIKTRIVSEGSNMGFTWKAKKIMSNNGIIVLDGILANQGGVDASIIEADQNRDGRLRTFEEVLKELDERMKNSFEETLIRANKYDMNLPDAAMALGIERVIYRRLGKTLEEILAERAGKK